MATHSSEREDDPAFDGDFDYTSNDVNRPDLVADLEALVEGEVRFDTYSRRLYATDASAYEAIPIGVVFPTSTDDVQAVLTYCADSEIPVLPRGGGTSLAGQSVNEAVVLDFTKHMNEVLDIDAEKRVATAQPGVRLGDLNARLMDDGLKFAPDPAWGDKSALGGAIGNNSTGAHSLKYGKTDAYVEDCEVVLADGTVTRFGEVTLGELRERAGDEDLEARIYAEVVRVVDEEREVIEDRYPELKRNVSGYNLDVLVDEAASGETVNLARLLAGSEGTLAVVTEATVSLEPIPETKSVALLTYSCLTDAMEDVALILEHDPSAVEVMDDTLLDLARDTAEFADIVGELSEKTGSVLLVEFYAENDAAGRQKVADLRADRVGDTRGSVDPAPDAFDVTEDDPYATDLLEAHDKSRRKRFWKMRKSGLPILLSRTSDQKHISFIEDCAVPPENLPEYVRDFQEILNEHDTFASFYAHAGPGVLHIRPLIDTKSVTGTEQMEAIADAVTDCIVEYGGSVSGEHGDGRARTQWNRKLYGDELWQTFRDLKSAFDPNWILNPGNVCGDHDMTENLRFGEDYEFDLDFEPALQWENENGFQGMAELCHGCGGCRGPQETTGGVMCPTYRATEEEIQATRGRANLLRDAMKGDVSDERLFEDEFIDEVLDLCIGCKGCSKDCPSEVDMAKLKTEVMHAYHKRKGASYREKLFANVDRLSALGSAFAPISNWTTAIPGMRTALENTLGIARERSLPTFRRQTLQDWFNARGGSRVSEADAERRALLFPDTHTNYSYPEVGKAAVHVLEAANVHVDVPDRTASGRPPLSKGFIEKARTTARENVDAFAPRLRDGWDLVVVEPSDAVMFQSDYLDLLSGDDVAVVANKSYGVLEYVDVFGLDEAIEFRGTDSVTEQLTYHGHCHQKATKKDHHAVGVLRRAGYVVDPLDSTCCGMAGSFGYEAEHLSMSEAIADIVFTQADESDGDIVVASGASCRTQFGDRDRVSGEPPHPIEKVAETVVR